MHAGFKDDTKKSAPTPFTYRHGLWSSFFHIHIILRYIKNIQINYNISEMIDLVNYY